MTALCGLKLETCRFLDQEMAFAIQEAKQIEFTESAQAEWVARYMDRVAYPRAREMEAARDA